MEKNSIKQMFRMPVRTASFFILIVFMGFLLSLAAGMYIRTTANLKEYESRFRTIGTVSQTASSVNREFQWDAGKKDYVIREYSEYEKTLPLSVLDFEGADYIEYPEKRSYYVSYSPEYNTVFENVDFPGHPKRSPVVEFSPVEDCVPDHTINIKITSLLYGDISYDGVVLMFCDHYTKNPEMLYHDKTYVAAITHKTQVHGEMAEKIKAEGQTTPLEFVPVTLTTNSYDAEGNRTGEVPDSQPYYEVTDGFYESTAGQRYLNYAKAEEMSIHTFPVTGTNSTMLLLPFYSGNAYITDGRDISKEAYDNGMDECLVSATFAENNGLQIGDSVTASFWFTSCDRPASESYYPGGGTIFRFSLLADDGSCPEVFETKEYTIVGIYDKDNSVGDAYGYQAAEDEMIVPLKTIEHKDTNILAYGPMNEFTTSFQIPNGTIDQYMEKWAEHCVDDVEITFYDKGYSKLEEGMKNMRFMSVIFGMVGIILGVVLLIFYSRMFIGGQKVRISIERCMGITVPECRKSLLSGAMLLLLIGSITGCILGTFVSGSDLLYHSGKEFFDMTYSTGAALFSEDLPEPLHVGIFLTGFLCVSLILATGYGILRRDIGNFLKKEPLYLMDEINRE